MEGLPSPAACCPMNEKAAGDGGHYSGAELTTSIHLSVLCELCGYNTSTAPASPARIALLGRRAYENHQRIP